MFLGLKFPKFLVLISLIALLGLYLSLVPGPEYSILYINYNIYDIIYKDKLRISTPSHFNVFLIILITLRLIRKHSNNQAYPMQHILLTNIFLTWKLLTWKNFFGNIVTWKRTVNLKLQNKSFQNSV